MTSDKIRVWLFITILGLVTLGSFWVWELMRRNADQLDSNKSSRIHPDYYVENFNFIRLSKSGESSYRVSGKSLVHYPREDEYKITDPHIIGFDQKKNPVNLRANSATAQRDVINRETKEINDEIHLFGDVVFTRESNGSVKPVHLTTPYLLFLPNKKMIKSDQVITIKSENATIFAVGMNADYANDRIQLLSNIDINIEPTIKKPKAIHQ